MSDTMWAGGSETFDETGGFTGSIPENPYWFWHDQSVDGYDTSNRGRSFVDFTNQFQGMSQADLMALLQAQQGLSASEGSYNRQDQGGDDPGVGTTQNYVDWFNQNDPRLRYRASMDQAGNVRDVSRDNMNLIDKHQQNGQLTMAALFAAGGMMGGAGAGGGASAAADPMYGGAMGNGAITNSNLAGTMGTGATASAATNSAAAAGGSSLWDQVGNLFSGGNTDWGSLLGTAGSIWGASQAEDANDAILANAQQSGQRLTGRLDDMQDGMFTPYSYTVGGRTATSDANGTNVGADPRTAAVQAAQMQAIQQSQRDPNQLANTMFGNYRNGVQDYESGQFDALQAKLERQGLAGLSNARSNGNPHMSAFARGVADSNASNYNNFYGLAERSNQNAASRASMFSGMDNTMFNQGANLAQRVATGNQQNFNNQTTLFDQYAGIEEMQLNASNQAIAGDLARQQALVQNLFGLGGANRGG